MKPFSSVIFYISLSFSFFSVYKLPSEEEEKEGVQDKSFIHQILCPCYKFVLAMSRASARV